MDPGTSLDLIVLWKYKSFKSLTDIKNQLTINLCKSVSKAGIENWNKVKWPSSPNTSPASTANDRELMAAFVFSGSFFRQQSLFFLPALPYFLCRPWSITIKLNQFNPTCCSFNEFSVLPILVASIIFQRLWFFAMILFKSLETIQTKVPVFPTFWYRFFRFWWVSNYSKQELIWMNEFTLMRTTGRLVAGGFWSKCLTRRASAWTSLSPALGKTSTWASSSTVALPTPRYWNVMQSSSFWTIHSTVIWMVIWMVIWTIILPSRKGMRRRPGLRIVSHQWWPARRNKRRNWMPWPEEWSRFLPSCKLSMADWCT